MTLNKIKLFKNFLNERKYTITEINKAFPIDVQKDMRSWNRLVKITEKEFDKIFCDKLYNKFEKGHENLKAGKFKRVR